MPVIGGGTPHKTNKPKHRGFFGSLAHDLGKTVHNPVVDAASHVARGTGSGLYHGVTGMPTGMAMMGRSLGHDLIHPASLGHGRFDHILKQIAQSEYDSWRHFGKGGDVSGPLLDALAALSGGGALVGKSAAVSRAVRAGEGLTGASRAIRAPLVYDRAIPGTPHRIPASPNPAIRGVQKLALKNKNIRNKAISRREIQAERFARQMAGHEKVKPYSGPVVLPTGVKVTSEVLKPARIQKKTLVKKTIDAPMNVLRLSMWLRPRYYMQNLTQTGTMLAGHPLMTSRSIAAARNLHKIDPKLYKDLKNMVGEGQALSLQESALAPGRIMHTAGRLANEPEAHVRILSALNEMRKEGVKSNAEMKNIVAQLKSGKPSSKALNIAIRANEEVGDFGRLTKNERLFIKTQVPIFYPMFKALTRYGYRLPSEHAIQSAAGLAVGKRGKQEQKRLLGDLPFWGQYLVPKSAGDPNAKAGPRQAVFNPANIYNLQPAADITTQAFEPFRKGGPRPGVSFLQEFGPFGQIAHGVMTGRDLQTGYPLRGMKGGKHNAFEAAMMDWVGSLPGSDLSRALIGVPSRVRSYEQDSTVRRIMSELFGPSVVSRTLITKETTKQAKREKAYGHGRKKRKKAKGSNYGGF